ncbi:hypothetical protein COM47_20530 [Bacillus wiedmannii]|uniref:hypothetical protein n=1 Tax=Bacillus wiedmannii TaxID=1890302 RepID=UPI000BF18C50|nr:hypothetical protein [Bacillus wiedmannii]MDR4943133.1 hypothetical protein [Bacillus wiedmannii]MED3318340.1 hypothetical protein [Bacillus wiedmannii]PEJ32764.1 hypothetical protein CN889_29690 [Bacillus wiedmannii]PGD82305.1 hypothetical protein COM47_20530 [Bacillus wiedmannii]
MFKKLLVAGLAFAAVTSTQVITANAAPVEPQAQKSFEISQRASVPFVPNACITIKKVIQSPNNTRDYWILETMSGSELRLEQSNQVGGWFKTIRNGSEIEVMTSPTMSIIYGWRIL